jgi:hypothetical protein
MGIGLFLGQEEIRDVNAVEPLYRSAREQNAR